MCGISACLGLEGAKHFVYRSLKQLSYRGYDSAGLAYAAKPSEGLKILKTLGSVDSLGLDPQAADTSRLAFGHTRWATHGEANLQNCHPHRQGRVTLVHNGVIENTHALLERLKDRGYPLALQSDTDSEILAALLDSCYAGRPLDCLREALPLLEGSFALVIAFADHPDELYCVRKDSSLILAEQAGVRAVSSDLSGLLELAERTCPMPDRSLARLLPDGLELYDWQLKPLPLAWLKREAVQGDPGKGTFAHYMLKEIHEEPAILDRLFTRYIQNGQVDFGDALPDELLLNLEELYFVACGTSYHAALLAKPIIERISGLPCRVEIASEFRYGPCLLRKKGLFVVLSQSGETADTLASLKLAKAHKLQTLALLNVPHSAMAELADHVLLMDCGPEISVASTKAYQAQLALLMLLALKLGSLYGERSPEEEKAHCEDLLALPEGLNSFMRQLGALDCFERFLPEAKHIFYLGRGLDYALAAESALKLKEITYLYAEAYAAGELKHGTISLIEPGLPSVAFAIDPSILPKTLSNLQELRSRGGQLLLIASAAFPEDSALYDCRLNVPTDDPYLYPFYAALAGQMLAYRVALKMGRPIDKPRNLAKSVTVE